MLVLSRKKNERILLPGLNVAFVVVEIRGDRVRLGIEAPMAVPIIRGELAGRKRKERKAAPGLADGLATNWK
jgi:carbon storage regulator